MLIISGSKSYYRFDKEAIDKQKTTKHWQSVPVPRITQKYYLTFDEWQNKYADDIEEITSMLLDMIITTSSEKYVCHLNVSKFKSDFVRKMYHTSYNNLRRY
jgi:hypothetical protein